jgi:hypothetical protein
VQETDAEVVALTNPKKLNSLQKRLDEPTNPADSTRSSHHIGGRVASTRSSTSYNHNSNSSNNYNNSSSGANSQHGGGQHRGGVKYAGSSNRGKSNTSAYTAVTNSNNSTTAVSFAQEVESYALRWFRAGQEFFYRFVLALDSYAFGEHLKRALAAEVRARAAEIAALASEISAEKASSGTGSAAEVFPGAALTACLARAKVAAKFLGLLTFGHHWSTAAGSAGTSSSEYDLELEQAGSHWQQNVQQCVPALPLQECLLSAWQQRCLTGVLPWVADHVRMMHYWTKHNSSSSSSSSSGGAATAALPQYYRVLLGTLLRVHAAQTLQPLRGTDVSATSASALMIACELEDLFEDLGIAVQSAAAQELTAAAPPLPLRTADTASTTATDASAATAAALDDALVLGRRLVQNCCPYIEELISIMERAQARHPLHSSRPLRTIKPLVLSPRAAAGANSSSSSNSSSSGTAATAVTSAAGGDAPHHQRLQALAAVRTALSDTFFHSQLELRRVADTAVALAVSGACEEAVAHTVDSEVALLNNYSSSCSSTSNSCSTTVLSTEAQEHAVAAAVARGSAAAADRAAAHCVARVGTAVTALAPPKLQSRVVEVAATLATRHAVKVARARAAQQAAVLVAQRVREKLATSAAKAVREHERAAAAAAAAAAGAECTDSEDVGSVYDDSTLPSVSTTAGSTLFDSSSKAHSDRVHDASAATSVKQEPTVTLVAQALAACYSIQRADVKAAVSELRGSHSVQAAVKLLLCLTADDCTLVQGGPSPLDGIAVLLQRLLSDSSSEQQLMLKEHLKPWISAQLLQRSSAVQSQGRSALLNTLTSLGLCEKRMTDSERTTAAVQLIQ